MERVGTGPQGVSRSLGVLSSTLHSPLPLFLFPLFRWRVVKKKKKKKERKKGKGKGGKKKRNHQTTSCAHELTVELAHHLFRRGTEPGRGCNSSKKTIGEREKKRKEEEEKGKNENTSSPSCGRTRQQRFVVSTTVWVE